VTPSGPWQRPCGAAEASSQATDQLVPRLVAQRDLAVADDIAAVLQHRRRLATTAKPARNAAATSTQRFIAGMIPEAVGAMPSARRYPLDQRKGLIEARANALAEAAAIERPTWARRLGEPPMSPTGRRGWTATQERVAVVGCGGSAGPTPDMQAIAALSCSGPTHPYLPARPPHPRDVGGLDPPCQEQLKRGCVRRCAQLVLNWPENEEWPRR
jgi:hypothetical protein